MANSGEIGARNMCDWENLSKIIFSFSFFFSRREPCDVGRRAEIEGGISQKTRLQSLCPLFIDFPLSNNYATYGE